MKRRSETLAAIKFEKQKNYKKFEKKTKISMASSSVEDIGYALPMSRMPTHHRWLRP